MRILLRIAMGLGLFVLVALLAVAGHVAWSFGSTRPRYSGEASGPGLGAPVEIVFSDEGVPHVMGRTEADVFYGLGYLHASERFFQMDMTRRFVAGRLSELLGSMTVRADARARQRGFPELRDRAAASLSPELRASFEAYAAGVNARLAEGTPSPEHRLLLAPAEPWTVEDCLSVVVYMGDRLASGLRGEAARAEVAAVLEGGALDDFFPDYPDDAPTTLHPSDLERGAAGTSAPSAPGSAPGVREGPSPGSNAWVVAGSRSKSGAPLLANDPHLGIGIPSIWYLARLALPDGDVVGATIPGAPLVILGRNEHLAWGFTNAGFDVTDHLSFPGDEAIISSREEIVEVRFSEPVRVTVAETKEGAVLEPRWFGLPGHEGRAVWRSTLAHPGNRLADAVRQIMSATTAEAFVVAGRLWTAPMQNMVYATADGHIGYTAPGKLPLLDASGDWVGFVPWEELPRASDPERGYFLSSNNRVTPERYPHPIPGRFDAYRAVRLEAGLEARPEHDLESFAALQNDEKSALAERLRSAIERAEPETEAGREAQARLSAWDGVLDPEEPEGLIYAAWYRAVHRGLFSDEFGSAFARRGYPKEVLLEKTLTGDGVRWCDDVSTPDRETCALMVGRALDGAMRTLSAEHGPEIEGWRWGQVHEAVFAHGLFGRIPGLKSIYTVRIPVGGDDTTLDVGGFPLEGPYDVRHAASMRALYDLSDLDRSRFVHAPGQSGHPLSPHFSDLAERWRGGETFEIPTLERDALEGRRLTLVPEG